MKWLKRAGIALGGSVIVLGAPVVPQDLPWRVSYETMQFDTKDGDLDFSQYADAGDGWYYVRTKPKDEAQFKATTSLQAIQGKTEVAIRCEKCAYFDEFYDGKKTVRIRSEAQKYKSLGTIKHYPQPAKQKRVSVASSLTAGAAIAYDTNTSISEIDGSSGTSWSHTTTGTNPVLLVGCAMNDSTDTDRDITAMTYNSSSGTSIRRDTDDTNNRTTEIWYKAAPSTGSNTVAVTYNANLTETACFSASYTGVDQTTPLDANGGTTQTNSRSISSSVTTVADNSWVVWIALVNAASIAAGKFSPSTGTERQDLAGAGTGFRAGLADIGPKTPAGSQSIGWSCDSSDIFCTTSVDWTISGVAIKPVAAAGGTTVYDQTDPDIIDEGPL